MQRCQWVGDNAQLWRNLPQLNRLGDVTYASALALIPAELANGAIRRFQGVE
jgi:hypothetical protein